MSLSPLPNRVAGDQEAGVSCPHCGGQVERGEPVIGCRTCGTVHHQACWDTAGNCGSYICAPPRKRLEPNAEVALRISADDLARAWPLPARPTYVPNFISPMPQRLPRTNGLAIAAFVCALAGIPFFGLLTGLVAILLGSLALGAIRATGQKGTIMAVIGVLLGLGDVVGWLVLLWVVFSGHAPNIHVGDFRPDLAALENLDPKIERAMRANVLIESGGAIAGKAIGSGVILKIVDDQAWILTNRHVVDPSFSPDAAGKAEGNGDRSDVEVQMVDQTTQPGRIVWIAPGGIDLALIRVASPGPEAKATRWKIDRRLPRVGEPAFAIGNPHGLGWTHTQGTISQLRIQDIGGKQLHVIQTQTVINAGNSGGGLYDQEGYLIGIATWTQNKRVAEGLNFAISLETLRQVPPPGLDLTAGSEEPDQR